MHLSKQQNMDDLEFEIGDEQNNVERKPDSLAETTMSQHYHGHRDRLRKKFANLGVEALSEYELLEMLLFRSIPRRDTKPIAKALLEEFGSLGGVLGAPIERLEKIKGLGPAVAADLRLIHAAAIALTKDAVRDRPLLSSWREVVDYCHVAMAFENIEQFRVLFLDKKNRLIRDEVQQRGTVDHTPVYPREVIRRALELASTAIILVHNHPSGDPTPSNADVDMTRTLIDSSKPLGITIHDHIIISSNGHVSMRGLKLI